MGYVEGNCPKCGKIIRESCNTWLYGSPIRKCPSCKSEFLDNRWREVAIEGFDPRANNSKLYVCGFFGFLLFTAACVFCLIMMINKQGHYPIKLIGCIVLGVVGTIGCLFVLIRKLLGFDEIENAKAMKESLNRMQDEDYVEKLIEFGYDVPEIYRR